MATAMEGATVMRRQRRAIEGATEIYDGNTGDCNGRRDRATAVAAMVDTTIATAADGKTTINKRRRQWTGTARRQRNSDSVNGDGQRDGATAMDGDAALFMKNTTIN